MSERLRALFIPVDLMPIERDRVIELKVPQYKSTGAAAVDLVADVLTTVVIPPRKRMLVPTGIAIHIGDPNFCALISGRSGNGIEHGIHLSQGIGILDSDYTGEVFVPLTNSDEEKDFVVAPGDRIAQMRFASVFTAMFNVVPELNVTDRGAGGFGSTGRQ